jgi:trehalose 6-phosphate phosphatase
MKAAEMVQMPNRLADISHDRTAVFLDVDGTLLNIAERPEGVVVPEDLPRTLDRLREACGGALALVTGREIATVDGFFAPLRLAVAGVHGAEIRLADGRDVGLPPHPHLAEVTARLQSFVERNEGLILEKKGRAVAIHFRQVPELCQAVENVAREALSLADDGLELQLGKMVVELRPARADKGAAIDIFMETEPFRGREPLFIGDDWTDESAFQAVNARGGRSIRVGRDIRPTEAKENLPDADAVREWLARMAGQV